MSGHNLLARIVKKARRKYGQLTSIKLTSARFDSEAEFLQRFDASVSGSTGRVRRYASMELLLSHFQERVRTEWPASPLTLTDLRIDLATMTDAQIVERANAALDGDIHPSGLKAIANGSGQIDWHANPSDSREWLLMMNRHSWWVLWGVAYKRTGDEAYAQAFVDQFRHWIDDNPLPRIKSEHVAAWRLMEVGLRVRNSWIPAFQLFFDSPHFDAKVKSTMLRSLFDHGQMLCAFFTNRNHLVRESNGLLALGLCFSEFADAGAWVETAAARLDSELKLQINDDGSQIEMSVGYQWLSVDEFGVTARLLRENAGNVEISGLDTALVKMYEYLAIVSRPDGSFPQLNDGFILWNAENLATAGRDLGHRDIEFVGSGGQSGREPGFCSRSLPNAGLHVMRSDWTSDARWLIFDTGPYGGPHGHEDKLSFELSAFGAQFVVDPGSYTYNKADPYREYFVGSQGHNSVLVDGGSQIRRWSAEHLSPKIDSRKHGEWQTCAEFDFASGQYAEGFATFAMQKPDRPEVVSDVVHQRDIVFSKPDFWIVIDYLDATQTHDYNFLFHLAPNVTTTVRADSSVHLCSKLNGAQLLLIPLTNVDLTCEEVIGATAPIQGWYSEDHHKKCPSPTISFHAKNAQPLVVAWLLYPLAPGKDAAAIRASLVNSGKEAALEFELKSDDQLYSAVVMDEITTEPSGQIRRNSKISIANEAAGTKSIIRFDRLKG